MTFLDITPFQKPIHAVLEIPGSKSYTNRALVMAALTKGSVILEHPLYSEDTEVMISSLRALGLRIETKPNQIIVHDDLSVIKEGVYDLFVGASGTTMRFLLAVLCLVPGTKYIRGSARMNQRPMEGLVDALRALGAEVSYLEGVSGFKISSSSLHSKAQVTVDASMSSQFVSALLMIAPLLDGLTMHFKGIPISQPYIDMTVHMMREWGIAISQIENGGYQLFPGQRYSKSRYLIEADYSSAGYFFAIAALTGSTITLQNLHPQSMQADRRLLTILANMGNGIYFNDDGITIVGRGVLPFSLNMEACPDQVQTMAVLAAFAPGITRIEGVRSLRVKETERVKALASELSKMGIRTEETHDTLTIYGGGPHAAMIDTHGDHRMAMAFAVAGTQLPGMKICNPEVVNKTFPSFWEKLGSLCISS